MLRYSLVSRRHQEKSNKSVYFNNRCPEPFRITTSNNQQNSGWKLLASIFVLTFLFGAYPDALALTDGDFREEVEKAEKLITGGYLRIGLFGVCGVAAVVSIAKQSLMGLATAGIGAFFVYLMKGWITSNFSALI